MPLYPPNPGAGTSGGAASPNTTQVGGVNGGNLISFNVDPSGNLYTDLRDGFGNLISSTSGALNVSVANATLAVTQSGTWNLNNISGTISLPTGAATSALQTTGNASLSTIAGAILAQGSTTSGQTGNLILGAVTTAAPTYTTAQSSPLSLDTAGNLRVVLSGGSIDIGKVDQGNPNTLANAWPVELSDGTNLLGTAAHPVRIDPTGTTTQPISGTVTSNIGTTNGLALDATVAKLNIAQGTALGANTGPMIQGSVTTAAPTYTTGQISPLSLLTTGALRIDTSSWLGSTAPTVGQKTMTNSLPIVIASDQNLAPFTALTTTGTITALNGTVQLANMSCASAIVTLTGVWTATCSIQGLAADGATWLTIVSNTGPTGTFSANASITANGTYKLTNTAAFTQLRVIATAFTSGTVNVGISAALPAGISQVMQLNPANMQVAASGDIASGTTDSGNPVKQGFVGITALPTAVTNGQRVNGTADKFGRKIVLPITIRDLTGRQTTTISASTAETTIVTAGGAGVFNDIVMLIISNTSVSTNTRIDFRDTTGGAVLFSLQSIGGGAPVGFALPVPIPQTTANTNWTAQCASSTTDIRIFAVFAKNQ